MQLNKMRSGLVNYMISGQTASLLDGNEPLWTAVYVRSSKYSLTTSVSGTLLKHNRFCGQSRSN